MGIRLKNDTNYCIVCKDDLVLCGGNYIITAKEDGSGYFCVMKADIEAFDMKNGNKVYSFTTSYESNGKNWNECVSKGKDKIAEYIVTDIIYGL